MEPFVDLYHLLQVHPEAETEIIQSAYKRLCRKYHPDINPSPQALERTKQLNAAYEILGDERKRRLYHMEWQRRRPMAAPPPSAVVKTEVRERVVYVRPEPERFGGGSEGAYRVIYEYFQNLAAQKYREAFALVCEMDKLNFTYGSFVEWQDSVSALYEIGRVRLKLFRRHPRFKAGGQERFPAEEFSVTITEKVKKTGIVSEYAVNKYAVLENNRWKVYLGYRDLTPLMLQFRSMLSHEEAQLIGVWERHKDTTDLTMGLPNRSGFCRRAQEEEYRRLRYARPFSAALFQIDLPDRVLDAGHRERVIRYIGYIINQSLRPIDQLAYFGDRCFAVILAETGAEAAQLAAQRITRAVRHDIAACFDFEVALWAGWAEAAGQDTETLIALCTAALAPPGVIQKKA